MSEEKQVGLVPLTHFQENLVLVEFRIRLDFHFIVYDAGQR